MVGEERPYRVDGGSAGSQLERRGDDGRGRGIHGENAICAADIAGRDLRVRRDAASQRAFLRLTGPLSSGPACVLGDSAEHRSAEPLASRPVRDRSGVEREDTAARSLDATHKLVLDVQTAYEPVEVRGDDHVRLASFDGFDGFPQSFAVR